ncbi:MAG: DNA recombination protein RmuC, partial [Dehalococcoidia bacterium]|nr:DNA recombination protein RmuC [Dehalococcoidia bacterium]
MITQDIALIALAALIATLAVIFLTVMLRRGGQPTGPTPLWEVLRAFGDNLARLETGLKEVETRVVETGGGVRESLLRDFQETHRALEAMKAEQEAKKVMEEELRRATWRIEAVIAGSRSRGKAGENILSESFKHFPPELVETDFRVAGRPVEFALRLIDGKRVPIDSKWPKGEVLEELDRTGAQERRVELVAEVEKEVETKVREVARYIDTSVTVPWAVAAVPDAVFNLCRRAHLDAFKQNVVLMPYGLTIPYLLSLYNLHLQSCRSIQTEQLEEYLVQIDQSLEVLSKNLENRVSRAVA